MNSGFLNHEFRPSEEDVLGRLKALKIKPWDFFISQEEKARRINQAQMLI